jgi:hypothetical protein
MMCAAPFALMGSASQVSSSSGSLEKDQEERPRPDFDAVVQRWTPPVMQG